MAHLVTTQELSVALNISVASINYYSNLGLFNIEDREGNKRLYDKEKTLSIYKEIRHLRKRGYTLRLIQQKLNRKDDF